MNSHAFFNSMYRFAFCSIFLVLFNSQGADSFVPTAHPLNTARTVHTATLLSNGNVLAAGGLAVDRSAATTAEIYDPNADAWTTSTHPMTAARYAHQAVLLQSGKVLLAGGYGNSSTLLSVATAELYDPTADAFASTTGNMVAAHAEFTATLLASGKVLLVGGIGPAGSVLGKAEIYDPAADTFTATVKPLLIARYEHGDAAAVGESADHAAARAGSARRSARRKSTDPATNQFTFSLQNEIVARTDHAAVLLQNGKVLLSGGQDATGNVSATSEIYDPVADSWAAVAQAMTSPRAFHTLTPLPDGSALAAGGEDGTGNVLSSAELYDPVAGTWTATPVAMSSSRAFHSATLLTTNYVLLAGGTDSTNTVIATSDLYGMIAPGAPLMFTSGPTAAPSSADAGVAIAFSATATGGLTALTYTWDFGDGLGATGASVSHVYVTTGNYTATVTASDKFGSTLSATVPVTVTGPAPTSLVISKAAIKLNFVVSGIDSIVFSGSLAVPAGFKPAGASVLIDVGGIYVTLPMAASGSAKLYGNSLAMTLKKTKLGVTLAQVAKFTATVKGSLAATLANAGIDERDGQECARVGSIYDRVQQHDPYQKTQSMSYTAKQNVTGMAK